MNDKNRWDEFTTDELKALAWGVSWGLSEMHGPGDDSLAKTLDSELAQEIENRGE